MRAEAFKAVANRFRKQQLLICLPLLAGLALAFICVPIGVHLRKTLDPSNPYLRDILPVLPLAGLVIAGIVSAFAIEIRVRKRLGCHCPHCGEQIASPQFAAIVIASGNCPACGKKVLDKE